MEHAVCTSQLNNKKINILKRKLKHLKLVHCIKLICSLLCGVFLTNNCQQPCQELESYHSLFSDKPESFMEQKYTCLYLPIHILCCYCCRENPIQISYQFRIKCLIFLLDKWTFLWTSWSNLTLQYLQMNWELT